MIAISNGFATKIEDFFLPTEVMKDFLEGDADVENGPMFRRMRLV